MVILLCVKKNRGLLCCTGSCNITLFVVLHFLCTSVSECAYRCCAALITLYPSYSRTSFVKPREEKCNYILLTLSANKETGFLYLGFYKSLSIIKWANVPKTVCFYCIHLACSMAVGMRKLCVHKCVYVCRSVLSM